LGDGPNLYGYVGNDPVTMSDPNGLSRIVFDRGSGTITIYDNTAIGGPTSHESIVDLAQEATNAGGYLKKRRRPWWT
jgi:hypothetical protein